MAATPAQIACPNDQGGLELAIVSPRQLRGSFQNRREFRSVEVSLQNTNFPLTIARLPSMLPCSLVIST
jgi:hypothetical protein